MPKARQFLSLARWMRKGRVDSTAHFWGTVQVDQASRAIERRNPQDWIATVYANAISPGTAHTVHYGFRVPDGIQSPAWKRGSSTASSSGIFTIGRSEGK